MKTKKNFIANKRAYFFSLDALIALLVIISVVIFIKPSSPQIYEEMNIQEDFLDVLSSLKINEINNSLVEGWINDGTITNTNQSVLQQLGEFFAIDKPKAEALANDILDDLDLNENIGIYFENQFVAGNNHIGEDVRDLWTSRQIVSGIQEGEGITGYSSRASLFSQNKGEYFYFGGYVGDGNISFELGEGVISANIECVFSGDFDLYINEQFAQTYNPTSNIPFKIDLQSEGYSGLFNLETNNKIEFKSLNNLYVAGGYIKAIYNSSEVLTSSNKKNLPGINGLINIYDSFYLPGELNNMEISLHYNSLYDIFLTIGETLIYQGNTGGIDDTVVLTDAMLNGLLDYSEMSNQTIPLRLGLKDVSYNYTIDVDAFSVTDLSGSMDASCFMGSFWCCLFSGNFCGSQSTCNNCGGEWEDKLALAKQANNAFIDAILNNPSDRVGLVGYESNVDTNDCHDLSQDNVSLKSKVDDWIAGGYTCICCGINEAVDRLISDSPEENFRSVVVMSDGEANVQCAQQGTGSSLQDAIQAACDAYVNYNIKVYAVGFGSDTDETTLQSIASCGGGNYYYGDIDEIILIYEEIADDIIEAAYSEQTVIGEGIQTKLFPDSYIFLDYEKNIPYNLVVTAETNIFGDDFEGSFYLPAGETLYEANVISYSGSKWTKDVEVYNSSLGEWENVFNLSTYTSGGLNYIDLGDPYVVNIPNDKISEGDNLVKVYTGLNPLDFYNDSRYSKIIYSVLKDLPAFSEVLANADGCIWTIEFEDTTNNTMIFPTDYTGINECFFTSAIHNRPTNDAINQAVYNLFESLDLDNDYRIETKFSEKDLMIDSFDVEGIPYMTQAEAQVRVWR